MKTGTHPGATVSVCRPTLLWRFFCGLCGSVVMTLFAAAAPARLPFEPPPPPPDEYNFRDTWWFGKTYEGNDWTIVFHADGKVTNADGLNTYKNSGSWKSTGNSIHMELNQQYYEYKGNVVGDLLAGDSSNVAGLRWKTNFRRIPPR